MQDVREAPARDDEWFDLDLSVRGRHVTIAVDGKKTRLQLSLIEGADNAAAFGDEVVDGPVQAGFRRVTVNVENEDFAGIQP